MNFRIHLRTLALGSMLALAVAGVPAVHAHAEPNNSNEGIEIDCPLNGGWVADGGYVIAKDANGVSHRVFCEDGQWVDGGAITHYIATPQGTGASSPVANTTPVVPGSEVSLP